MFWRAEAGAGRLFNGLFSMKGIAFLTLLVREMKGIRLARNQVVRPSEILVDNNDDDEDEDNVSRPARELTLKRECISASERSDDEYATARNTVRTGQ